MQTQNNERAELDEDILAWIKETPWRDDEERFDVLARRLFAHQFAHCAPYARFARGRGRTPESIRSWQEIPAVPAAAFKEMALRCFPEPETKKIFRTSGTSGQKRGALHLDTLALYEASLLASLHTQFVPDLTRGHTLLRILAPSAEEVPDSSLSHMFSALVENFGSPESGFDVVAGKLQDAELIRRMQASSSNGEPIVFCGTAFAFVHMLDRMQERNLRITCAKGSRIMETGGFKGRSREIPRQVLHDELSKAFGIEPSMIINQYGMTELGSQFYDWTLIDPTKGNRKRVPPWVRVRLIDPENSQEVTPGEPGMITLYDLANSGSVSAIQTADLGRWISGQPGGFEVLGRRAGEEERGCSIAADEMLGLDAKQ